MCNAIQTNFLYKILLQTPVAVKFFMGDQSFEIHGTHILQFINWHISLNGDLVWKACCKSFSEKYLSDGSFQLKDILNKCPYNTEFSIHRRRVAQLRKLLSIKKKLKKLLNKAVLMAHQSRIHIFIHVSLLKEGLAASNMTYSLFIACSAESVTE